MNSSKLLDKAVDQFASLPGVGRKTALKFVLHLLKKDAGEISHFIQSIEALKKNIKECHVCHNIADSDTCEICADPRRDRTRICVVENIKDILSIEATSQYNGLYHVLGGIISPMDGIGPADLTIASLLDKNRTGTGSGNYICFERNNRGRHNRLLYFQKLKTKKISSSAPLPRYLYRQQPGIYRRTDFGTLHCQPGTVQLQWIKSKRKGKGQKGGSL